MRKGLERPGKMLEGKKERANGPAGSARGLDEHKNIKKEKLWIT